MCTDAAGEVETGMWGVGEVRGCWEREIEREKQGALHLGFN